MLLVSQGRQAILQVETNARQSTKHSTTVCGVTQKPLTLKRMGDLVHRVVEYEDLSFNSETGHDQDICTC